MLKIKPFQKTFLSETMQRNYMYYFSASPSSREFRTKIESQIGPCWASLQPKQGEHIIFRNDNIYGNVNARSILATTVRASVRRNARRNDAAK
jgi:hypothetical protein